MAVQKVNGVVVVEYQDLVGDNCQLLRHSIEEAFGTGPECLGIIFVKNIPEYVQKRQQLLPLASKFAQLPAEIKAKYERPDNFYLYGWSHGKEIFNGKFDSSKGFYRNNPQYDSQPDPNSSSKFNNVWPESQDLPELEPAFKDLGRLIVEVGSHLAKHCDDYIVSVKSSARPSMLTDIIQSSSSCKARLLHYFAPADAGESLSKEPGSWCGWHLDHGALTGLTSAMYMNDSLQEVSSPDPSAGLYIKNRKGDLFKAVIPSDHLAFQMGQAMQIESGGLLRATWHSVQGASGPASIGIARNTFAVFMQPNFDFVFRPPLDSTAQDIDTEEYQAGQTFNDFQNVLVKKYHTLMN